MDLKDGIDPAITSIVPVIATSLASANIQIKQYGNEALNSIIEYGDPVIVLHTLSSVIQFGATPKSKPLLIEKMAGTI